MVLLHQSNPSANGSQATARKINGRKLSRKRKEISPSLLALIAADLVNGGVAVSNLTPTQASGLTGASVGYIHTASKLTPEGSEDVKRGRASSRNSTIANHPTPGSTASCGSIPSGSCRRWRYTQPLAAE